jgi:hypothetical protein
MMKNSFYVLLFSVFLLGISEQAQALRCGRKIIKTGDKQPKVLARCGEPDFAETQERSYPSHCRERGYYNMDEYSHNGFSYSHRSPRRLHNYPICHIKIVDVWTYNFGPRKFIKELVFRDGSLKEINSLEYGY